MCVLGPLQKVTDFSKCWMDYGWWPLDFSIHVVLLHMTFLISFRRLAITSVKIELWVSPLESRGFIIAVQSLSLLWLSETPWTATLQATLSLTISQILLRFMSIELVVVMFSHQIMSKLSPTPWTVAHQASLSLTISLSLLKLIPIESMMSFNNLILYCPLLLFPSIFPRIGIFSNKSVLHIRWPKCWSFSISASNEYSGLISFRIDCLITLLPNRLSKVFSSTTVKHQFFSSHPSLWPNSHIHTWLLKKT